ncbi:iron-containing alcohol dehydrogenase-like protein [Xylogone sp. PMI_703]|nr:iron-containing alcohol dehydrogenase-like protein [Xylogone sp. PMI_703]
MAAQGESYRPAYPDRSKPYISSGLPFQTACAHHVKNTFKASRVYVIVSSSISKTENFTKLQDALGDVIVGVRKGIRPHTPWDDVIETINDMQGKDVDLIVTLGAGSLTDGAKFISLALANNVNTTEGLARITIKADKPAQIPIINIPTSLSGGEYNATAGATDTRTGHKVVFYNPSCGAQLIILDPVLTTTTPRRTWFASGIRAVDHCVEGLCSLSEKANDKSDEAFAKGLKALVPSLLKNNEDWNAEEPRLKEMLGVVDAMQGLSSGVPMGASHGIGHQLGPLGVGHGETSCVMLPSVLKYTARNGDEKVKKAQQKVLDCFWGDDIVAYVLRRKGLSKESADAGDVVGALVSELGLPRSLRDVGVTREQFDQLADNCLKDEALKTNAVPILEKKQVLEILEMAAE